MEYGLIGERLGHSFSKTIHSLIGGYEYSLVEIPRDGLEDFLVRKEFCGINVTIPYKESVISYLDNVSEEVRKIGACNTIVCNNGVLSGYNTDYYGLRDLIIRNGIEIEGRKVLILGTGGTSHTARALVTDMGASQVKIASRRAGAGDLTYSELADNYTDAQVIINATPCGMFPSNGDCPLSLEMFSKLEGVVDVIYNPIRSNIVLDAIGRGIKAAGGLYMLVAQAVYASAIWFGKEIDSALIENIYGTILSEKENICLIGMPSAGKTTCGEMIAEITGREFYDSDIVIEEKAGMTIPEIFATKGEKAFRELETEVIAELAKKSSCIIATGGGVVLNPLNMRNLKQNGKIYFLDRNVENLLVTGDRPLSSSMEALRKMYEVRLPLYQAACDEVIDVNHSYEEAVADIKARHKIVK